MSAEPIAILKTPDREPPGGRRIRKTFARRNDRDVSQPLRLGFQLAFLAVNAWIGVQFFLWVRYHESGGVTRAVSRPAGVEGWLPIAALMNLKAWVLTGTVPRIHPAAMFILIAALAMSLLLKKAFCSWLCPVGTLSELLWKFGGRIFGRNRELPRWADLPLRSLKYVLLAFFAFAVARMSPGEIGGFMESPYGIVADVKLLDFFRFIGTTGVIVIATLALLSMVVKNFWCRYLCPYGALLGIVSMPSAVTIRRDADKCIDCAKCAKACPARLPVDRLPRIRSAECSLCMTCVAVCPAGGALDAAIAPSRPIAASRIAAAIAILFLTIVGAAKLTGHWRGDVPEGVYRTLVGGVSDVAHPQ